MTALRKLQIQTELRNDVCILRLKGRFVTGSDDEFLFARDELRHSGLRKVLADCRELPYIDSTGLAFMVDLYTELRDSGGRFVLAGANPRVRQVLQLTRLDRFIPILADEQAALEMLTSRAAQQSLRSLATGSAA